MALCTRFPVGGRHDPVALIKKAQHPGLLAGPKRGEARGVEQTPDISPEGRVRPGERCGAVGPPVCQERLVLARPLSSGSCRG